MYTLGSFQRATCIQPFLGFSDVNAQQAYINEQDMSVHPSRKQQWNRPLPADCDYSLPTKAAALAQTVISIFVMILEV